MRRAPRIALNVCSIIFFVLVLILWTRSHLIHGHDVLSWQRAGGIAYAAVSKDDRLILIRAKLSSERAPAGWLYWRDINAALGDQNNPSLASHLALRTEPTSVPRQWGGREGAGKDHSYYGIGSERVPARCIFLPYWLLAILFALAPVRFALDAVRKPRRIHAGCCVECGYDLRATPDRCPECGTIPSAKIPAKI